MLLAKLLEKELAVLYEDDDCIILDKPEGHHCHPHGANETNTMVNHYLALMEARSLNVRAIAWSNPLEFGLVHRLDQSTSGILVFAKTLDFYNELKKNWKTNRISKIYTALCTSTQNLTVGQEIKDALGHAEHHKSKIYSEKDKKYIRGKWMPAHSKILSLNELDDHTLVRIEIYTGVTHQIRVHLSSYGSPIIGDILYGGITADRIYLHASEIKILKENGTQIYIKSNLKNCEKK